MKKMVDGKIIELTEEEIEKIKNESIEEEIEESIEEKVEKLKEENKMLKECIIELSEIVYA